MSNTSKVLSDVFFGTQQSKYAAVAYFITIAIMCLAVLFSNSDIPLEHRFVVVIFILIITIPSVLFSLFELTCIVTGGSKENRWWCYWLAWFMSFVLIIYCLFIIISLFFSMSTYDLAMNRINEEEESNKITKNDAENFAKDIMQFSNDEKQTVSQPMQPMQPMQPIQPIQPMQPMQPMQQHIEYQPPMPKYSQPSELFTSMSNDNMGYDKNDNLAPISENFFTNEKVTQKENFNTNTDSNSKAPEAFGTYDTLQPY